MKNKKRGAPLIYQALVVFFSLLIGVSIFLFLNFAVLPYSLPIPETTAVNWLVLHKHSMTLDYIRFGLFVLILQTTMIAGWSFFVWKKRK